MHFKTIQKLNEAFLICCGPEHSAHIRGLLKEAIATLEYESSLPTIMWQPEDLDGRNLGGLTPDEALDAIKKPLTDCEHGWKIIDWHYPLLDDCWDLLADEVTP